MQSGRREMNIGLSARRFFQPFLQTHSTGLWDVRPRRTSAQRASPSWDDQTSLFVTMKAKPEATWTPENVTARDLTQDSAIALSIACSGCRGERELNVWTVGRVLADTPLQTLRFQCRRCGVYATVLRVVRRTSGVGQDIFTISLKPRCWDAAHQEAQRIALDRARVRFEARQRAALLDLASRHGA